MVPFENTWPYEKVMGDYYFSECPFCGEENILLSMKAKEVEDVQTGRKKRLVLPCCYENMVVVDIDNDYFLSDRKIRPSIG